MAWTQQVMVQSFMPPEQICWKSFNAMENNITMNSEKMVAVEKKITVILIFFCCREKNISINFFIK